MFSLACVCLSSLQLLQLIEDSRLAEKANLEAASTVVATADNGTTADLGEHSIYSETTALLSLPN